MNLQLLQIKSMTKVVHCKKHSYDVLIDRSTKWGNPYSHKSGTKAKYIVVNKTEALKKYREWLPTQTELMDSLPELKDKTLGCWCASNVVLTAKDKPFICHGQILAELVDGKVEDLQKNFSF